MGGSFCVDRVELREDTVLKERLATFAARLHGKGRIRLHAIRLKPHVHPERQRTSERFFELQKKEKYHWFIQGRPVCQETYAEVCALGESCMQEIRKLASEAHDGFLDLSQAPPRISAGVRAAEVDGRECALSSFLDTLARSCCDAIPNGDTVDALASDAEYCHDDDDGGVEWKLPFRSSYFVWEMYVQAVEQPYSYPRFIVKWSQLCPHIKRAGKGKDGFCQCDECVRLKRGLMDTRTSPEERRRLHEESDQHNTWQMANRARYAVHISKAERAVHYAAVRDHENLSADADDASEATAATDARVERRTVPAVASITCDCGSSQKMGTLPAFGPREPKAYSSCTKLECKAMGVIIHHIWRAMLLFPASVAHGANMTCETIHLALKQLESMYGSIPAVIYIQLDNCSDNKCGTVLAYLYDLRRRGCLRKVAVCMLIVGHTHIDVSGNWCSLCTQMTDRDCCSERRLINGSAYSREHSLAPRRCRCLSTRKCSRVRSATRGMRPTRSESSTLCTTGRPSTLL